MYLIYVHLRVYIYNYIYIYIYIYYVRVCLWFGCPHTPPKKDRLRPPRCCGFNGKTNRKPTGNPLMFWGSRNCLVELRPLAKPANSRGANEPPAGEFSTNYRLVLGFLKGYVKKKLMYKSPDPLKWLVLGQSSICIPEGTLG